VHEFSIASALIDVVAQHVPPRGKLRSVQVEAGPLQGIDPQAMQWAWQALTDGGPYAGSILEVRQLPWTIRCGACGREWSADEISLVCACGSDQVCPTGGKDLLLRTLVVDQEDEEPSHAGPGYRERPEDER
jgi:hydrogenase nickel incorporation protein HypA/HybF